jgi:hypothetical protein
MWKKGIFHPIMNAAMSITNRTVGDQGIFGFRRSAGAQTARLAASSTCSNSKLVST